MALEKPISRLFTFPNRLVWTQLAAAKFLERYYRLLKMHFFSYDRISYRNSQHFVEPSTSAVHERLHSVVGITNNLLCDLPTRLFTSFYK